MVIKLKESGLIFLGYLLGIRLNQVKTISGEKTKMAKKTFKILNINVFYIDAETEEEAMQVVLF